MSNQLKSVDIILPVYNGQEDLEKSVDTIIKFFKSIKFPYKWNIIISDNASTDNTPKIARALAKKYSQVHHLRLTQKGRGIAVRTAWMQSKADIVSFMDVDLAVDLEAFPRLINEVAHGADICIGSRFLKESKVKRSLKREILSRSYNTILKILFQNKFSDAQCGFKAFNTNTVKNVLLEVKDNEWFFDTELLVKAERAGYKIKEIPFVWTEGPSTTVKLMKTSFRLLRKAVEFRLSLIFN